MNKYQAIMENALRETVGQMIYDGNPFSIIIATASPWEFPLPRELAESKFMKLTIAGWSLEQAYVDPDDINRMFVRVAFGDEENSKFINFSEIHAVMDSDDSPLFQRVFDSREIEKPLTMRGLMLDADNMPKEGMDRSMKSMIDKNPHLKKRRKE